MKGEGGDWLAFTTTGSLIGRECEQLANQRYLQTRPIRSIDSLEPIPHVSVRGDRKRSRLRVCVCVVRCFYSENLIFWWWKRGKYCLDFHPISAVSNVIFFDGKLLLMFYCLCSSEFFSCTSFHLSRYLFHSLRHTHRHTHTQEAEGIICVWVRG